MIQIFTIKPENNDDLTNNNYTDDHIEMKPYQLWMTNTRFNHFHCYYPCKPLYFLYSYCI